MQEPEIMGTLQKTCQVPSHQRSIIKNVRDDLITLPETNMFAPTNGWLEDEFPFGMARRVSVKTISCVVGGTFYTFSQQTWISWPSYIVYQGQESTSPNQPTELLVKGLFHFNFGYILAVGKPIFSKHLQRLPRLQRWLS